MSTVLIRNGRIYDGSGNPWFEGDIKIAGSKIKRIGKLKNESANLVIDARGKAVAPGFIDIHTHSDGALMVDGRAQSHVQQGVTTNVIGNCGSSSAPLTDEMASEYSQTKVEWRSLAEYLRKLERSGVSVNVVPMIGHGTVRRAVMGYADRQPTETELEQMKALVRQAMIEGSYGLTTGLIYVPGSYSDVDEIIALAKEVSRHGGIYASHIRGENDTLLAAVAEALEVGRQARLPVQIAHLKAMGRHMWGATAEMMRMIEQAREEGIDVTGDQYPYNASATGLSAYLPGWAHVGGKNELMRRLSDPAERVRLKHDIANGVDGWFSPYKGVGWENTYINKCKDTDFEGLSVSQIAAKRGVSDFDAAFDLLIENEAQIPVVYFTIGDEDIERIMVHPTVMIGSDSSALATDGPLAQGKPHPRSFGTFARVLGRYVREKQVLTLEEAIRKMTALPAQRLGLGDRGILRVGMAADIVIFDPEVVNDTATYTEPLQYPVGIDHVFVNGQHTVANGTHLGAKGGVVLRHNQS